MLGKVSGGIFSQSPNKYNVYTYIIYYVILYIYLYIYYYIYYLYITYLFILFIFILYKINQKREKQYNIIII